MIPKIIHYCWFGCNPLPELAQRCIASWKKYCPDYEIREWNDSNYDVRKIPYIAEAYNAKRFAFVSDYARFDILYNHGGIFFDVDVELIKPFDNEMLACKCFSGFEEGWENEAYVAPGLVFAGEKGCAISKELMDFYAEYNFIKENGELNLTASPVIFTSVLKKYGLKKENIYQDLNVCTIYPAEYFCPKSAVTGLLNITDNTVSIHHYDGSWVAPNIIKKNRIRQKLYSMFGDNAFTKLIVFCVLDFHPISMFVRFLKRFFIELGPIGTLKHYWKIIFRSKTF